MATTTTDTQTVTSPTPKYSFEKGPMKILSTPFAQTGATDQYTFVASEMTLVHNCISRAFNTIYLQAPHILPADESSFISYCWAGYQGLEAHHDGEENILFPMLEEKTGEKGLMNANIAQHEAFHTGFHAWGEWLQAVKSGKEKWDGKTCVAMMDDFIAPLSTHLNDEIPTLLGLARFGDKIDLKSMTKAEADKVMAGMSKRTQLPAFLLNHDVEFERGVHRFPPIPGPVIWTLREVFGRWNKDWWKFASCGFDGRPRMRLYVGDV
ncbi:hypothetical protein P154DRAFT_495311 [Amniculicola lignicola CBS 123094]|uniref:Hemerythrin-like domain-containing protein n=1 Tax=Amniculicola lignicola CBS 123094 TaxID=1392246 RepID=A0A6A5W9D4_9PLEO|nr:hypothetical protein P154DRAFT_495311 [Amniculicola lignicola CBS 123094]